MMIGDHLKLYKSLARHKVKYLLIGGAAVIFYGIPRSTLDIDIAIYPDLKNAENLFKALKDAGFGTVHLTTPEKILKNEISVFNDFIRLDVLIKPRAFDFSKAWKRRVKKTIRGISIYLASIRDIIKNKEAVGRETDKDDIKILKKINRL